MKREASNLAYAWTGHGDGSTTYDVDGLNRLTSKTTGPTVTGYGHDKRGDRLNDDTRTYAYDSETKGLGSPSAPWHHDPLGRLSGASTSASAPPAIAYESYVDNLVAERTPGSSTVQRRHVFGPGVDEPLVWYEGPSRRFLHADERGSIVAVTSDAGALLAINRYDEYGRTETTSAAHMGRFLYTGQRWFGGFGLYHHKNRVYDPRTGRFMQPDPIGYEAGMNLYAYVGGDPVNFTDPFGLQQCADGNCGDTLVTGPSHGGSASFGSGFTGRFQLDMPLFAGGGSGGGLQELLAGLPSPVSAVMCGAPPGSAFSSPLLAGLAAVQWEREKQRAAGDNRERSFGLHALKTGGYTFRHQFIGTFEDVPMSGTIGMAGIGHTHGAGAGNTLSRASDMPREPGAKYDVEVLAELMKAIGAGKDFITILGAENGTVLAWRGRNIKGPGRVIGVDTCN